VTAALLETLTGSARLDMPWDSVHRH
jgi:hypothetical protein